MKIGMFSVGPVFPNHVHGGSQKILREIAIHLGMNGHKVKIICTQRTDNYTPFQLADNVEVLPILRLRPTYPEPYYTAPYNIAHLIREVRSIADTSDVFYIHDAELPFHDICSNTPRVVSFRDFVYPDTLVGAFGFRRDELILNCDYVANCVNDAFFPFLPDIMSRTHVVPNGIDLLHFRPLNVSAKNKIRGILGEIPSADYTLLYPHRPDRRKGIFESIAITAEVNNRLSALGKTVRLLIPRWLDSAVATESSHEYQSIYGAVQSSAHKLGIANHVYIHDWIPYDQMPDYLSIGDVTLSVGNFVEAFGNVHLESVACGTPAVVSQVAAHSYNLPEPIVRKIAYGDITASADAVLKSCTEQFDVDKARYYLAEHFSFHAMLKGYEHIFSSAKVKPPLELHYLDMLNSQSWVRLAAWCRPDGQRIYNDYAYNRISNPIQIELAYAAMELVEVSYLENKGFLLQDISDAIKCGILVQTTPDRERVA